MGVDQTWKNHLTLHVNSMRGDVVLASVGTRNDAIFNRQPVDLLFGSIDGGIVDSKGDGLGPIEPSESYNSQCQHVLFNAHRWHHVSYV